MRKLLSHSLSSAFLALSLILIQGCSGGSDSGKPSEQEFNNDIDQYEIAVRDYDEKVAHRPNSYSIDQKIEACELVIQTSDTLINKYPNGSVDLKNNKTGTIYGMYNVRISRQNAGDFLEYLKSVKELAALLESATTQAHQQALQDLQDRLETQNKIYSQLETRGLAIAEKMEKLKSPETENMDVTGEIIGLLYVLISDIAAQIPTAQNLYNTGVRLNVGEKLNGYLRADLEHLEDSKDLMEEALDYLENRLNNEVLKEIRSYFPSP